MKNLILDKLDDIEKQNNVRILYACESGSRAWGFASPDSDYDVRFIYVHPIDYYLSIDDQRDVVELPINDLLDINGWELRKAFRLLRKSNAPLCEWLQSPVVYQKDENFLSELREQMNHYFSPRAMMHHYISMTKNVLENDLSGEQVRLKKYFYALRPILASLWIAKYNETPPMEFGTLREMLNSDFNSIVDGLLTQKIKVDEKFMINTIPKLNDWIKSQVDFCEKNVPEREPKPDSNSLNEIFRRYAK
ncbi:MAG TPA: nucleotidyltransferase domain-containing protein [Cyclobacteriaceae bacterium]